MSQHQPAPDIPIKYASIGWTPSRFADEIHKTGVIVIDKRHTVVPRKFMMTSGACFTVWGKEYTSDAMRLSELLELRAEIVNDGISLHDVDNAFLSIPEFRERKKLIR